MRKGFTLIEMAIVLIIIGVIIGGILVGRSTLETAKIQRLIKDLQQYEAATKTFKETYEFYPGDSSKFIPPGNDNDGLDSGACAAAPNGTLSATEYYQFYSHLSQAEMLDKTYVSYAPTSCGGSMNNNGLSTSLADITAPYTELSSEAAQMTGLGVRAVIIPSKGIIDNLYYTLYVKAFYVIPMETKLGSVVAFTGAVGLSNTLGQGQCYDASSSIVTCAGDAVYGILFYSIAQ